MWYDHFNIIFVYALILVPDSGSGSEDRESLQNLTFVFHICICTGEPAVRSVTYKRVCYIHRHTSDKAYSQLLQEHHSPSTTGCKTGFNWFQQL